METIINTYPSHNIMRYFLLFLFLILHTFLHANNQKNINIRYLNIEDGLSHHTINSIYQDEFGFVWIGTLDGLNRFNGTRIDIFKPVKDDTLSIRENNIRYICGDNNGHLFIKGLESISIYDMRTNTFKMILDYGVKWICWKNDLLWLAVENKILKYDVDTGALSQYFSFHNNNQEVYISAFGMTDSFELYISTVLDGFYRVNKEKEIIQHIPMAEANLVTEDSKGHIWVASRSEGLYCISRSGSVKHYQHEEGKSGSLINNNVRTICEDEKGNFYVGTYDGLCYLESFSGNFLEYKYDFQRTENPNRSILTMMRDHQGSLWIGTFYEGIHQYNTKHDIYRVYYTSSGEDGYLTSGIISSIVEDNKGNLWLGTEGGGINIYNRKTQQFRSMETKDGLSSNVIKSLLYEEDKNIIWASTLYDGINLIDLSTGKIKHIHNRIYYNKNDIGYAENIVKIVPAGDSLLLATNKGLVIMDRNTFRMTKLDVGLVAPRRAQIWDVCFDTDGFMWLTSSTDLYRVNMKTKASKRYIFKEISGSLANNYLNCILKDSKGRIWFGSTGSGLFLYDSSTDSFKNYDSTYGLDNDFITAIIENKNEDQLYIATNSGISTFYIEEKKFVNYGGYTGFPVMRVNENGLYMTEDKELYISGHRGLISVMSNDLHEDSRENKLYISDIYVNNNIVCPGKEVNGILTESSLYQKKMVLQSPQHSVVAFAFTGTDFLNRKSTRLEYMLEGFDPDFVVSSGNNIATYTNLNPGKYTFLVRDPNVGSNGYATMELLIKPPFYKTVYFFLISLFFALVIIFFLIRSYTQGVFLKASLASEKREKLHLEQVNRSKLQFFTNISHELRTPLTLIDAQLEILLMDNKMKPAVYSNILSIYKHSMRMQRLIDEVLDIRRQEQGYVKLKVSEQDIIHFLREIFLSFEVLAKQKNINYLFVSDVERLDMFFDPVQMEKVIYNLLSNAFKYTPQKGEIRVTVKSSDSEYVEIIVSDNGLGIHPEHIDFIFDRFYQEESTNQKFSIKGSGIGLALSKGIVEMHQGKIAVISKPREKTSFTVTLGKKMDLNCPKIERVERNTNESYLSDYKNSELLLFDIEKQQNTLDIDDVNRDKILIVEDNHEVSETLQRIFEHVYQVYIASNGKSGIEMARKLMPDIILSDVMMPHMSGIEMCRLLKSDFATCHIPIILLTARGTEEHQIEGLITGADDYITKPFKIKLLMARCNNLIVGRRAIQQKFRREPDASVEMLSTNPVDNELLRKAIEVVEKNIDNPQLDIQMFAHELGLSRTYLFAKIKGLVGQTPNEFIINIRLKKAVALLVSSPDSNISEIAYNLGFNSLSYFIKCFKNTYGKSPGVYRKENGK